MVQRVTPTPSVSDTVVYIVTSVGARWGSRVMVRYVDKTETWTAGQITTSGVQTHAAGK